MIGPATTRLTSKGQVVIPEQIHNRLGLQPGAQFVVVGIRNAVILKVVEAPEMGQFDELLQDARAAAKRAGMKERNVKGATEDVRKRP